MTLFKTSLLAASLLTFACGKKDNATSDLQFDSAHSIALDGTIADGKMVSSTDYRPDVEKEIREQLMYSIGFFNGYSGGPDMNRLQLSISDVQPREDGLFDVTYAAKLFIAWPRLTFIPPYLNLVLPERGDWEGLGQFFETYSSEDLGYVACMSSGAHDFSVGNFWYYYRPEKLTCPLAYTNGLAVRTPIELSLSEENTEDKYPEYAKVWEDGALVVTAIFGKNEFGATSDSDAGISAYRDLYFDLLREFGTPASTNLAPEQTPSAQNDDVRLVFNSPKGKVDVHIYLVDEIKSVTSEFITQYNERTQNSDFVSYSGHSGLGANIKAMARMGNFVADQYQIFLINGCDTFAYVDNALRDAHQAANPGAGPDKYFDIMTNAMPSYFHTNSRSNMAMINGLIEQEDTYRDIMSGFDMSQRVNVTGEQDNKWPQAF
jgi:hypothetical protein